MESEPLLTIAEIAVGITGFTGVVVVFGRRPGVWSEADRVRVNVILFSSVSALVLALCGVGLEMAGLSDDTLAAGTSGLMLLVGAGTFVGMAPQVRRFNYLYRDAPGMRSAGFQRLVAGGSAVNLAAQLANVLGLPFGRHFAIFFFGLVWVLFVGLAQFVRVLFARPPDDEPAG